MVMRLTPNAAARASIRTNPSSATRSRICSRRSRGASPSPSASSLFATASSSDTGTSRVVGATPRRSRSSSTSGGVKSRESNTGSADLTQHVRGLPLPHSCGADDARSSSHGALHIVRIRPHISSISAKFSPRGVDYPCCRRHISHSVAHSLGRRPPNWTGRRPRFNKEDLMPAVVAASSSPPVTDGGSQTWADRLGMPGALRWGFVGLLIFMIGDGVESGYLAAFLLDEGVSQARVGLLFTVYGVAAGVAAWASGALSDLWGPRRVMAVGRGGLGGFPGPFLRVRPAKLD